MNCSKAALLWPRVSLLFALLVYSSAAQITAPVHGTNATRLPLFEYERVILAATNLHYRPHNDIIYPSVVKVRGRMKKPLGKYYLYYAPHDAPGGICMAFAEKPDGSWTEYGSNPLIKNKWDSHYNVSHVSGPDVIWDDKEQKLFLYFHGENDVTRLASSKDGVHFSYEGAVVSTAMFDQVSEASYGRVFEHALPGRNNRYVMLLMGNNQGTRRIYLAWSMDGRKWESRRTPFLDPPPGTDQVAGAIYLPWQSRHYFIFHGNNSKMAMNQGFDLYVAEADAAFSQVRHLGKFLPRTFVSEQNPAIMSPYLLRDEGRLFLFFNIGSRLNNQIAVAREVEPGASALFPNREQGDP